MTKHVRLLVLSQHLASVDQPYKATFVYDHAKALNTICDVTIIDLQPSRCPFTVEELSPRHWERGVPSMRVSYRRAPSLFGHLSAAIAMLRVIRGKLAEDGRPMVVHAHWWASAIPAILACKIYGIPLVITEHGSRWSTFMQSRKGLLLGRLVLRSVDMVLPVSSWLQAVLVEQGVRARMRVVPNIVQVDSSATPEPASRDDLKTLAIVGRLAPEKGIDDAIKALAILQKQGVRCRLEVIGGGGPLEGERLTDLRLLANRQGVGDAVVFHGAIARTRIAQILRNIDVLVSATTTSETFGVAVAEGLAAGVPVVATRVGAIPELISQENGILVDPRNPEALAIGISEALAREWNSAVISRSVQRFRWQHVLEETLSVYRSLGVDV